MRGALNAGALAHLPAGVQRPGYDVAGLGIGIVHLGLGAFHRAHQALYTDDAIRCGGGDWGIAGASLRHAATPEALGLQDQFYTVETLAQRPAYRIIGALRSSMTAAAHPAALLHALQSARTHIITLTITERGYCLGPQGGLDLTHPDIQHDLKNPLYPKSAVGWLARALSARHAAHQTPVTVISCDNLKSNGTKLGGAVGAFFDRTHPKALPWLRQHVCFPQTVVDCIVPAASVASRERVAQALGVADAACVQREPYGQWVIEDRFAGPRPAWEEVGVQIVADTADYALLKLHVLNTCHSALAYLGLERGHTLVREAIADAKLAQFLEDLVGAEIAPALHPLPVLAYWGGVRERFQNRHIDHRLAQIAEDGAQKLAERVYPLMIANLKTAAPIRRLACIVRAWLAMTHTHLDAALQNPTLFPPAIRSSPAARAALAADVP